MIQRPETFRRQTTLGDSAGVEGFGFWSGRDVRAEFRPAAADTGIVFVRSDLPGLPRIPAHIDYCIETPLRTTLRNGVASVEMVEHLLAALFGLQVDNCEIWVNAPEMPGLDGSSRAAVKAIRSCGLVVLDAWQPCWTITEPIRVGDEKSWIEARPSGCPGFFAQASIDYGRQGPIGEQSLELEITPHSFSRELADARTFILKKEAECLRDQGLATRVEPTDVLVLDDCGPIDNQWRFFDECVRHKLLDLVGDLSLAGCDLSGQLESHCGGHRLNAEMVKAILKKVQGRMKQKQSA